MSPSISHIHTIGRDIFHPNVHLGEPHVEEEQNEHYKQAFEAAPDFSGYLLKILQNHTVHACDRDRLSVSCPPQTSISILSAFYGRRVPSEHLCPSTRNTSAESINCAALTAIPKVFDECQDQSSCQFSVNSRVFGLDPCPGTNKYLIVSFKCKPGKYKAR
ncbi:hypothetical protein scyTo_0014630 [Scyliorhinus torazame]|uniref:SUEL-type lectin domain-containing protein n=1 Tax=Scyliorhinus torazame TaxID=75743 RepID=A0A401NRN7_SCYTO|nr:hypothetical protein [Scyliorhinus torazame]